MTRRRPWVIVFAPLTGLVRVLTGLLVVAVAVALLHGGAEAQVNVVVVSGNPATGPYAVEAQTTLTGSLTVNFFVDGTLFHQEGIPKYCLFGGDAPCATGTLGAGSHVILAQALDAGTGALLGQGQLTVTEGAWLPVSQTGQWTTLPYTMPINPIHLGLLHTGKVLVVAGSENDPNEHLAGISKAAVWNLQTGTFVVQYPLWDLFCNGMAFLPDGRALIVGGTEAYDPFTGDARATIFDPMTETLNEVESMAHGRWYATTTMLNDGRILTFAGFDETGAINRATEVYRIAHGFSPEVLAPWTPPNYPWMHLLPNGKVFVSGAYPWSNMFDPATSTWTMNIAQTTYANYRVYGSSVLLPLLPANGYVPRVMIMGGMVDGSQPATASAEIIDLSQATPQWRALPPMSRQRVEMNATLLPNGKVLASGGSARDNNDSTASRAADLFDPVTETWSSAGNAAYARMYHSAALLLPDATVVTTGSNPIRGQYEQHIEIWTPPYLFNSDGSLATRPTISTVPARIGYAGSFTVTSPDAASISSIALMRPGSPTHAYDMEQRLVGLTFSAAGTTLTVSGPPNASIAPPGYYMLFILNNRGVPSIAKFVQVLSTPNNQPPRGTITQPTGNVTISAGQAVTFAGSGFDPDGAPAQFAWVFPGGSPGTVLNNASPGSVTFTDPGTYVASLTVVDSIGENDPSPPTRTITVTGATNQPPTANPGGPYTGTLGQAITFNGSGSSDPDGQVVSYLWSFGDGGTATSQTPTHTYANAGSYTVSLAVTDNNGAVGSATTTANVVAPNNQPPSAPTALFVQRNNKTKATLTWTDNSGNETGFKIERSADGTTFTEIATVGANVTMYQDSGVPKAYYYRVRAYNSAGNSGYSNTYQVTPP